MSRFSDYLSSQITPQMTLLEKFNALIKFLKENNYISVFYSQENYNIQTESYQKEKVNLNGFTLHIGDCIVFSNGYYAFVETIGVNNFTIGNVLYFQGEQGVSVVGATISSGHLILTLSDNENIDAGNIGAVSNFSIDANQHLIVNYANGTTQDLGAIFNGNISISGNLTVSGNISGNAISGNSISGTAITGDSIIENMSGYTFSKYGLTQWTPVYCGVCKNGNKLTFVVFGVFNSASPANMALVNINIPQAIGQKLYPYTLGSETRVLDVKEVLLWDTVNSHKTANIEIEKYSDTKIAISFRPSASVEANTDYAFRIEATFLLSDNL